MLVKYSDNFVYGLIMAKQQNNFYGKFDNNGDLMKFREDLDGKKRW